MSTKKFLKTRFESISEPGSAFQVAQQIRNRVPLFGSANRSGTGFRFSGRLTDSEPGSIPIVHACHILIAMYFLLLLPEIFMLVTHAQTTALCQDLLFNKL